MSTVSDSTMDLATAVEEARAGADLMIRCTVHDDGRPSLHVSPGKGGNVAIRCFAGCNADDIVKAGGVHWGDLFADDTATTNRNDLWTPRGDASRIYPYTDEYGTLLFEVLRVDTPNGGGSKTFMQRRPDTSSHSGWSYKLDGVRRVLYRLPEVVEAVDEGKTVWLTEGEKDVETVRRQGKVATTMPMGAGKWLPEYTEVLRGADIIMCVDADGPGREHARMVREILVAAECTVELREPAGGVKDVTDHIDSGGNLDSMVITTRAERSERAKFGIDIHDVVLRKIEDVEYVIPGTLAKRERLLVTGFEGLGKSNFLRMLAACTAAGIHPFTMRLSEPKKVVVMDAENEPGQTLESWQLLIKLCEQYGAPIGRDQLIILEEWDNADMDLASSDGKLWLHERIEAYKPDLLLMGPLTNVVGRDLKDDEPVRKLKATINSARTICGTAFVMEHHAPHRSPNEKRRSTRPYGSSMFLRWPDFGYGLLPTDLEGTFEWSKFRWPRVRTRAWPQYLKWGNPEMGEFPWVETMEPEGWKS